MAGQLSEAPTEDVQMPEHLHVSERERERKRKRERRGEEGRERESENDIRKLHGTSDLHKAVHAIGQQDFKQYMLNVFKCNCSLTTHKCNMD